MNVARLKDLENEIRQFKTKIARLEAENRDLRTRIQDFDDRKDSLQTERSCFKEPTQAEEHQELGHIDVPKTTQPRKETFEEGRKEAIGMGRNMDVQIDSQNIPLRNAHADMERTTTGKPTTTSEQPVDNMHYHTILPMSVSDFDDVWERVKHSLQNIIVGIPQILADRHDLSRPEELLDLPESDE